MRVLVATALSASALIVAACSSSPEAPYEPGVCFYVVPDDSQPDGLKLNVVARDQPQIEFCAARLEEMRVRFLRLGGTNREIMGAYQGQYIFIDATGVSFGKSLEGSRFFALARTGDGRLAIPGAIQRRIDGTPVAVAAPPPPPAGS